MDEVRTRGAFLRDLIAIAFLIGGAIQLVGNFDALLQLSKLAKGLVEHWNELIELPLRQLLLYWGIRIPPNIISLLIINILPSFVVASVGIQFYRTRPELSKESSIDIDPIVKGIPHRRTRLLLGIFCVTALVCVIVTQILAHTSKTLRSISDNQIYSCFAEKNARTCRDYFFIRDIKEMPPVPAAPWSTSDRDAFISAYRRAQMEMLPYSLLLRDGFQFALLLIFSLCGAFFYFYRYWVSRLLTSSHIAAHASRPGLHHALVARLSFLSVIGTAYARIILATFTLLGLSIVADLLPGLVQRLIGLLQS